MTDTGPFKPIIGLARLVIAVLAIWIALALVSLPTRLNTASKYAALGGEGNPNDPTVAFNQLRDQDLRLAIVAAAVTVVTWLCVLGWLHRANGSAKRHDARLTSDLSRPLVVCWLGLGLLTAVGGMITTLLVIYQNTRPTSQDKGRPQRHTPSRSAKTCSH